MKIGDLVKYYDGFNDDDRLGVVTEVTHWSDKGAPSRNFGTDIVVLWQDGESMRCCLSELRLVSACPGPENV